MWYKSAYSFAILIDKIKNNNYLYFLGGFVEGEGSNSVAVSVGKEFKFGVNLQPIFNVSQHVNGINILYSFKELFGAGSVVKKSGSDDVWVYTIKGYKQIIELVLPFLETYVQPFSCKKDEYSVKKKNCFTIFKRWSKRKRLFNRDGKTCLYPSG